jgi:hypothetical protein
VTRTGWGYVFLLASGLFYSMERLHDDYAGLMQNPYVGALLVIGLIMIVRDWIPRLSKWYEESDAEVESPTLEGTKE